MKYPDRKILLALIAALALAGCGGGGGGGDSSSDGGGTDDGTDDGTGGSNGGEVEIDSDNGETVARKTAVGASSIGQSGAEFTQAQIVGAADVDGGASAMSVAEAAHFAILQARDQASGGIDAVTGATTSYNCQSGSATIEDNGGTDGVLEQGDNWHAIWNDCAFSFSGGGTSSSFLIDGEVEFTVTTCDNCDSADDDGINWEYGVELAYTDWLIQASQNGAPTVDILFDGTLVLSAVNSTAAGTTTFSVTGGPFTINDNLNGNDFEYTTLDIEHEVNTASGSYTTIVNEITMTSSTLNGDVTASTAPGDPLMGDGGYPTSGTLNISGAGGSSATVAAGQCSNSEFGLVVNNVDEGCKAWESGV